MIRVWKRAWLGLVACAGMTTALSAQEFDDVEIETIKVSGNVYILQTRQPGTQRRNQRLRTGRARSGSFAH